MKRWLKQKSDTRSPFSRVKSSSRLQRDDRDRPVRLFWPEPSRRFCNKCRDGRGINMENQSPNRACRYAMLAQCIQDGEMFTDNAAQIL